MAVRSNSTPESRRSQARGRASRDKILQQMLALVDERGFEGATIAELGRRTGLPASSIYWHFADKDELTAAAIQYSFQSRHSAAPPWPSTPDGRPLIEQLVQAFGRLIDGDASPDYMRIGLGLALQRETRAPKARKAFLEIGNQAKRELEQWWASALAGLAGKGVEPAQAEAMAQLTLAGLHGRYLTGRDVNLNDQHTMVLAQILVGAARHLAGSDLEQAEPVSLPPAGADDGLESRERFIRATIEALCDYGPAGATVSEICKRADLPASSLYWHFDDHEALIEEALQTAFQSWSEHPRRVAVRKALEPDLDLWLATGIGTMRESPAAFRIGYMLLLRSGASRARIRFREIRRVVLMQTAALMALWLGVPPPEGDPVATATTTVAGKLAWATMTFSDGLFIVQAIHDDWPAARLARPLVSGFHEAVVANTLV